MMPNPNHPARFSEPILVQLRAVMQAEGERLGRPPTVLDSFAGTGRIHQLRPYADTLGVELEPEWAACHPDTLVGDALDLPASWTDRFDVYCSSPCMEQSHLVVTDDLRWVPVGTVQVGDRLLAFDEHGQAAGTVGTAARRRWRRTEVVRSVPRSVECVRVILENGVEVITTPEHPWLAYRYNHRSRSQEWVPSARLMGPRRGNDESQPYFVLQQMEPWVPRRSFDAGWLSGMFDGEGSLSLGQHGSPKMTLCQVEGPVIDRAEALMAAFGYEPNRIPRMGTPEHRQKLENLYVTGGFPGMLRALGELRPTRLLAKWEALDISTRTVKANRIRVLAVEPAGRRDIQEIETSDGTYFGEGFLMHNCYGNRLADAHANRDKCKPCEGSGKTGSPGALRVCKSCKGSGISARMNYRVSLGRMPSEGSSAVMQWGDRYRDFHRRALAEAIRVTDDGGLIVVNVSNHMRGVKTAAGTRSVTMRVVEWWLETMLARGLYMEAVLPVVTRRMRRGSHSNLRAGCEQIIVCRKPVKLVDDTP